MARREASTRPLLARRQREQVEAIIALLIELLDVIDGDADDEPSLGSVQVPMPLMALTAHTPLQHRSARGPETYLKWGSQMAWASGATSDSEGDEHDGSEPDVDAEVDPAEMGIADLDGLAEQFGAVR